jgi:MurNAc alpha-1-phosphate uridylyltransferase
MRAMILAAGRGERMRKMTELLPKPLLHVAGHYLIEYSLCSLKRAGIKEIVINVSYRSNQIKEALGDGSRYGVNIFYSEEEERLETGGGVFKALPQLGPEPFLVLSSDVITDYPLAKLPRKLSGLAHLVLVDNPVFHPQGDFGLQDDRVTMKMKDSSSYTFANIGIYHPDLFLGCEASHFPLNKLLFPAVQNNRVTGESFQGKWFNVGTPEQLEEVNLRAREDSNLRPLASETNTLSN